MTDGGSGLQTKTNTTKEPLECPPLGLLGALTEN